MACEIFHVAHGRSFRWKWRRLSDDGSVKEESKETYQLFYECVCAARARGYQPNINIKCR